MGAGDSHLGRKKGSLCLASVCFLGVFCALEKVVSRPKKTFLAGRLGPNSLLHTHTTPVNSPRQRLHFLAIKKAVEPFKLHPTSMSYIYEVFEHLKQLWMGIWQHTHTVTTTELSPDLGELAEILDDVSVEMIPVGYH